MALGISFDFNGTPVVITSPPTELLFRKVPVYVGPTTLFNYYLGVAFDVSHVAYYIIFRLFSQTVIATTYQLSNQGSLTDYADIAVSNSMYFQIVKDGQPYFSDATSQFDVTGVTSAPEATGTFTGNAILYGSTPIINNAAPVITDPSAVDTVTITNGVFTDIPIQP